MAPGACWHCVLRLWSDFGLSCLTFQTQWRRRSPVWTALCGNTACTYTHSDNFFTADWRRQHWEHSPEAGAQPVILSPTLLRREHSREAGAQPVCSGVQACNLGDAASLQAGTIQTPAMGHIPPVLVHIGALPATTPSRLAPAKWIFRPGLDLRERCSL